MANRSYFYSLSNRPTSYADRPETISGLSEWAYAVPFSYRVLMSGDPQLCASLISDGFEDEPDDKKSKLYAISSPFEEGFTRWKRFAELLRQVVGSSAPYLSEQLDETAAFLEAHRDRYLLLETIELDTMMEEGEAAFCACVESERERCRQAGAAIDALPSDTSEAARLLQSAANREHQSPLDALFGLRLDDDFDSVVDDKTEYPLGLEWYEELYFSLWNRAEYEAHSKGG